MLTPHPTDPLLRVTGHGGDPATEVGPRHLLFRPDERFAYSSNEQDNSVTACS